MGVRKRSSVPVPRFSLKVPNIGPLVIECVRQNRRDLPSSPAEPHPQVGHEVVVQRGRFVGFIAPEPLLTGVPHVGADLEPIRQAEQPADLCLVIGDQRHPITPDHVVPARQRSAGEIRVGPDTEDLGRIPEGGAGERVVGVQ